MSDKRKNAYYPHMPIYRLLLVFFFDRRMLVTDISGVGWRRAMKFCRMVDLEVHQVFSPLVNFGPGVSPRPKMKNRYCIGQSLTMCDKLAGQSRDPCDKLASDRHVGITPVRTTGILVHMSIEATDVEHMQL